MIYFQIEELQYDARFMSFNSLAACIQVVILIVIHDTIASVD